MMLTLWIWIVQALLIFFTFDSVQGGILKPCGQIIPESPIITPHTNFTAICILKEKCLSDQHLNASHIFWKIKNTYIPKEQYTVINRTAASVTLEDVSSLGNLLTCNILLYGQIEQTIYGIQMQIGWLPEKPKNLHCVVNGQTDMKCQWDPGKETHLDTTYVLKSKWAINQLPDCIPPPGVNDSCTVDMVVFYVNTDVWVVASNALGNVSSDPINFDPIDLVKLLPPHNISVSNSKELSSILKVSWTNPDNKPFDGLKYNIRYRAKETSNWTLIPPEDTATTRNSFTVQDLKPFTEYVFSIRCMNKEGKGFWSNWSAEASGVTYEAKPTNASSFWYEINPSQSHGYRLILLKWKPLTRSQANGRILDYEVTLKGGKRSHLPIYTNDTKLTVNVTNDPYVVSLRARNIVGSSDPSTLTIPGHDFKAAHPVTNLKAFPKDNALWVEWTPPKEPVNKYILEWCIFSDNLPCIPDWQQETSAVQQTYLKGKLMESKCYLITVIPVYDDGPGSPQSVQAYLKQAPPSKGPSVRTKKVGKNEAVLVWDHLSVDDQNGFIRNYTIFYRTSSGNETAVHVNSSHREYTLSPLNSDTLYMVRMAAYTDEGGKDGPEFTFTTSKFAQGEIEAIVVPVCLAFLLITLLGVLLCFNKLDLIKKHIWPNVPDPSKSHIAQWSPHTPPRHNLHPKDQMYPEGNFTDTDVSVVEIEANVKKPSPEDLKSLDLFKKEKIITEGHSSGIGGSSCMSSSRPSISSNDESESGQNTSSTVQYSTVVHSGYRHQVPSVQVFSRSESTQPLLDSEERQEDLQIVENGGSGDGASPRQQYFKQNCNQDDVGPDLSHFERSKQVSSVNEEDFGRLNQQQISDQRSQSSRFGQIKDFEEINVADHFGPDTEGHIQRSETTGLEAAADESMPKSYLPQTVRRGGYVPQ
ncbi:interleukin-6 receptor subunit beta isoform X1 [Gracilinanus agilis]|uniref:interleukin-6 receptor subunit beta isoform X1 n=1 Tax=Gracilinanus agilis TaxID=191870 RepID=UPI001CFF1336|nr:interleukin-6 receptor subunit beta isoform X1 [Gracilinanus agilis]XP_044519823.1 interleukin-6 receptor subunit beta isoform X1 [Gracilinanus agilis]